MIILIHIRALKANSNNKHQYLTTMKLRKRSYITIGLLVIGLIVFWIFTDSSTGLRNLVSRSIKQIEIGQEVDNLNGVAVYYNDKVSTVVGRNLTNDGYNLGLKYQCVEFVKRYYYEHLNHKMPETYGHAKDFFDTRLADGQKNGPRNLTQYKNPSKSKPKVNDLLVFDKTIFNPYGHVAIVSKVTDNKIELIQQNSGPRGRSRETIRLTYKDGNWKINSGLILGWLWKD